MASLAMFHAPTYDHMGEIPPSFDGITQKQKSYYGLWPLFGQIMIFGHSPWIALAVLANGDEGRAGVVHFQSCTTYVRI
jgi:hypothetical protein